MSTRTLTFALILTLALGWLAGTGFSEEPTRPAEPAEPAAAPEDAPSAADPMAAYMDLGKPGPMHAHLMPFVGDFEVTGQMWHGPQPTPVTATASHALIFGGRHIEMHFKSELFGGPFEGKGHMGYDNVRKHFFSTWVDTMASGLTYKTGTCSEGGKVITMVGTWYGPPPMGSMATRMVWTVTGPDTFTMASFATHPQHGEYKEMALTYTRKK